MSPAVTREGLVECVPNVSEGRRPEVVRRIVDAARSVGGAYVLDVHSDPDHNRSVITLAGEARAVAEAAFRLAAEAVATIDMTAHQGVHPRIGALDVLPFVPLGSTPMATCVMLAREVGARIAAELAVPVYFYGEAARRADRRPLAAVRRGEYEGLRAAITTDEGRRPDLGPRMLGTAGATAVGARKILVAFNVVLRTADLAAARAIARTIRASSGGLPGVQALGLPLAGRGLVQVAMNLTDPERSPPHVVVERICREAERRGVEVLEGELVGLMPATAALAAAAAALHLPGLRPDQTIELALYDAEPEGMRA